MKKDTIKTSFAGGQFGASVFGRTDIDQYANACEIVQNFLIRPYGSAVSAPGTRYVATVSDSTLRARLIPFVFNKTDSYAIEMGDLYMRFFTNRGAVSQQGGTDDLSGLTDLKANWKCNDNTATSVVLDAEGNHDGSTSTLTMTLTTTGIVGDGFDLDGLYHISVPDHADFTRTASTQPMSHVAWAYYSKIGAKQTLITKENEYDLSISATDKLKFTVNSTGTTTKLLLHMDGTDASTTITDSSPASRTVTASGNAQIDTAQSKFGGASLLCDGTGDFVSAPNSADFDFAAGDFTIDFWGRFNTLAATLAFLSNGDAAGNDGFSMFTYANGSVVFEINAATQILATATGAVTTGQWYHFAVTRTGSDWRLFIDGVEKASASSAASIDASTSILRIGEGFQLSGGTWAAASEFDGWIDEVRIVKGNAVWTTDFTPPTSQYENAAFTDWTSQDDMTEGWHLFVLTFKGDGTADGDVTMYVDGVKIDHDFSADPSFVRMVDGTGLYRIGASSSGGGNQWNDKIDQVSFLHSELTAAEVRGIYLPTNYQITTVFTEDEIFDVQFAQLNDIVYLTHPNHPTQKLIRTSADSWTIADFEFEGGPFQDENKTDTQLSVSATTGTVNLTASTSGIFTPSTSTVVGHVGALFMIGGQAQTSPTTGLEEVGYVKITDVIDSLTATATVMKNTRVSTGTTIWAEGAWSAVAGYPASVRFHDSRLWFARTNKEPQNLWGSKLFEFDNFALDTSADDDALNLQLSSNESNEIQWLASGRSLLAGTFGGAFVVSSGGDNNAITPSNAHAREEVGIGSSKVAPERLGSFIYFVQRFGKRLREMFYMWDLDTHKAIDQTILSHDILGGGVVDMDAVQSPAPGISCVLTDGTMAILTRETDQELSAWSKHTTAGTYTSIAVIPSQVGDYDETWMIVERWVNGSQKKYIEYFEDPEPPARKDLSLFLHSALTYNAYESSSASACTISLSASSGSVTLTSSTAYFLGADVGQRIRAIDENGNTLGTGEITATASTTSLTLSITTNFNALAYASGRWGMSVSSIIGLDHLEAKTVGVLADGKTDSLTVTVASGSIAMSSDFFVISAGLSYDQIMLTLPYEGVSERGTTIGKVQRFNEIALRLNKSSQEFEYGPDADNLDVVAQVITPSVSTLYSGITDPLAFRGGYERGSKIYLKQKNPLPVEILSIMGTLQVEDK